MPRPRRAKLRTDALVDGTIAFWANVTIAVGDRRRITLGHSRDGMDRASAEVALRNEEALIRLGRWSEAPGPGCAAGDLLFRPFANEFYAAKRLELSQRGAEYISWALRLHLLPFFGDYPLRAIDRRLINEYKMAKLLEAEELNARIAAGERIVDQDGRAMKPLSHNSINKTIEVLSGVLNSAVEDDKISENAAGRKGVKLPKRKPRRRWLMPDEVLDLIDAAERIDRTHKPATRELVIRVRQLLSNGLTQAQVARELSVKVCAVTYYAGLRLPEREPSPRRVIIATLALAGLRAEELCRLCWRHIDLANRRIAVPGTKSDAAERYVKIVDFLLEELLRWRSDAPSTAPGDPVFATATGAPRSPNGLNKQVVFSALSEANRLRVLQGAAPIDERITPHSLRHTFASLMLAYGRPIKTVQRQMGHAKASTTLDIYDHVIDTDYGPTAKVLELLMSYADEHGDRPGARPRAQPSHRDRSPAPATVVMQAAFDRRRPLNVSPTGNSTSTTAWRRQPVR